VQRGLLAAAAGHVQEAPTAGACDEGHHRLPFINQAIDLDLRVWAAVGLSSCMHKHAVHSYHPQFEDLRSTTLECSNQRQHQGLPALCMILTADLQQAKGGSVQRVTLWVPHLHALAKVTGSIGSLVFARGTCSRPKHHV
jgi:hypothetical protein